MKPDLYTKIVLTVIAVCLVVLASKELQLVPNAQASSGDIVKVDIVKIDGLYVNGGELPVKLNK